jgi:hypothetical protein
LCGTDADAQSQRRIFASSKIGSPIAGRFGQLATASYEVSAMDRSEFLLVTQQLAAAAKILATVGPQDLRADALRMLELFRRYDQIGTASHVVATSNDELFARTGHAALTMAGRNEFAASHALLV